MVACSCLVKLVAKKPKTSFWVLWSLSRLWRARKAKYHQISPQTHLLAQLACWQSSLAISLYLVHVSWKYFLQFPPNTGNTLQSPKLNLSCLFFLNEQIFVGFSTIFKYLIHVIIIKAKLHQLNERSNSSLKATGSRSWPWSSYLWINLHFWRFRGRCSY